MTPKPGHVFVIVDLEIFFPEESLTLDKENKLALIDSDNNIDYGYTFMGGEYWFGVLRTSKVILNKKIFPDESIRCAKIGVCP